MIRINLLPVRQIKKRIKSRNELVGLLAGLVALLIVLAVVGYGQKQKIDRLHGEITQLNQEKSKYNTIIKQIKNIEKQKKLLEKKHMVIKNLKVNSQIPVRILDELTNLTPSARIWLKSMSLRSGVLVISGVALDNETIAQYMLDFMKSPFFVKAELKNSSMINVSGQKLKSFSLTVLLVKPGDQKPVKKK